MLDAIAVVAALASTAKNALDFTKSAVATFGQKSKAEQASALNTMANTVNDLYGKVLEAQALVLDLTGQIQTLSSEKKNLVERLQRNAEIQYDGRLWYDKSDVEKRRPYCPTCKESDGKLTHLQDYHDGAWWCVIHNHSYYDYSYKPGSTRTKNHYRNFDPRRD